MCSSDLSLSLRWQGSKDGLVLDAGSAATLTGGALSSNGLAGLRLRGGSAAVLAGTVLSGNGGDGAALDQVDDVPLAPRRRIRSGNSSDVRACDKVRALTRILTGSSELPLQCRTSIQPRYVRTLSFVIIIAAKVSSGSTSCGRC